MRTDGQEGFVPSAFVYPAENILQNQDALAPVINLNSTSNATAVSNINNNGASGGNLLSLSNNTQINTTNNNVNFMPASNINNQQSQLQQIPQEPAPLMLTNVQDDSRYGTELVMLYDYKAQAPDDLSVRRGKILLITLRCLLDISPFSLGELIYADLNAQTIDGWIWAFAPKAQKKCGKYGFIPKAYTQPYRQNTSV